MRGVASALGSDERGLEQATQWLRCRLGPGKFDLSRIYELVTGLGVETGA